MQVLLLALLVGLVALAALGFILYRLQQRRKQHPSNLIFRPHIDASGNFMCVALVSGLARIRIPHHATNASKTVGFGLTPDCLLRDY